MEDTSSDTPDTRSLVSVYLVTGDTSRKTTNFVELTCKTMSTMNTRWATSCLHTSCIRYFYFLHN